jgi:hypothetical protein
MRATAPRSGQCHAALTSDPSPLDEGRRGEAGIVKRCCRSAASAGLGSCHTRPPIANRAFGHHPVMGQQNANRQHRNNGVGR